MTSGGATDFDFDALGRAINEFALLEVHCHAVLHDFWDVPAPDAWTTTRAWPYSRVIQELGSEGEHSRYAADLRSEFRVLVDDLRDLGRERNRVAHTALWPNGNSRGLVAFQPKDAADGVSLTSSTAANSAVTDLRERIRTVRESLILASEALIEHRRAEGWEPWPG